MEKYPLAPLLKVREYREDAAKNALSAAERAVVEAQEAVERAEPPKAVKERTERPQRGNKAQQAARRQLTICERDIAKIEARITELDAAMEPPPAIMKNSMNCFRRKSGSRESWTSCMRGGRA